jgi:hypothetical protein
MTQPPKSTGPRKNFEEKTQKVGASQGGVPKALLSGHF